MGVEIVCADVLDWCESYEGEPFHAIMCDPSYALSKKKRLDMDTPVDAEIETVGDVIAAYHALQQWGDTGFMGRRWDNSTAFNPETWRALARHLHPGGFVMAFASSRGDHRLAVAMEDAGLILHPTIYFYWVNGQGFPKATRIKAKEWEATGEVRMMHTDSTGNYDDDEYDWGEKYQRTKMPTTDLAQIWQGHRYGLQALKPAVEPIIVAQKPYAGRPVDCIVSTGAGALWIDGGRVTYINGKTPQEEHSLPKGRRVYPDIHYRSVAQITPGDVRDFSSHPIGRWPPNFALVHCPPHLVCQQCHAVHPIQPVIEVCPDCGGDLLRVEGCKRVGVKRVKGITGGEDITKTEDALLRDSKGLWTPGRTFKRYGYADPDGRETVADFQCLPECPARKLGEQSGEREVSGSAKSGKPAMGEYPGGYGGYAGTRQGPLHNDKGTAARFYPQASWEHEEMECCWSCELSAKDIEWCSCQK